MASVLRLVSGIRPITINSGQAQSSTQLIVCQLICFTWNDTERLRAQASGSAEAWLRRFTWNVDDRPAVFRARRGGSAATRSAGRSRTTPAAVERFPMDRPPLHLVTGTATRAA